MSYTITRRQVIEGLAGVTVSSLFGGFAASSFAAAMDSQPTPSGPVTPASVRVSETPNGTIGPAFVGLSYENSDTLHPFFRASNTGLLNIFNLLGPSLLRIGGDSPDKLIWTPNGPGEKYPQISRRDVDRFAGFLKASSWQCLYAVNLALSATGETTPEMAADEVAYVAQRFGSSLFGIEIGNEPDRYNLGPNPGHKRGGAYYGKQWDLATYETVWNQYRAAIVARTPGVVITGPAAGHLAEWTIPFIKDQGKGKISLLTDHYYATRGHTPEHFTVEEVISPDPKLISNLKLMHDASQITGIPYRISECSSFYTMVPNVCDAYATSLWGVDFLLDCAQGGATGANFTSDGGPQMGAANYTSLYDDWTNVTQVMPLFYGLLFFHLAGQGTLYQTTIDTAKLNVTAFTVKTSTGLNIVIVNKDLTQNLRLTVQLPRAVNSAGLISMTQRSEGAAGPDLSASSGVTIQGSPVGIDGTFSPAPPYALATRGSSLTCYVPALSAVMIRTT